MHTLAKETSVHPKRLRKHLRAAGLVTDAQTAMSDNNIRIDADRAIQIARELSSTLSLAEAMKHFNAPRAQMEVLIKTGIVKPQQRMTGFNKFQGEIFRLPIDRQVLLFGPPGSGKTTRLIKRLAQKRTNPYQRHRTLRADMAAAPRHGAPASLSSHIIEPEVEMSRTLYARLLGDTIDLIVIPEAFSDPEVTAIRVAEVTNAWMARPNLVKVRRTLRMEELTGYPILMQGGGSGSGLYFNKWLKSQGVVFPRVLSSDGLTALVGLAVAGLGICYLPRQCFRPLIDERKLVMVPTKPKLPLVPYATMYWNDRPSALTSAVVELARSVCDFSRQLQE